jgi:hypothetical protein
LTTPGHDPLVDVVIGEAMGSSVTFVVRAARGSDGRLGGVVERVRTGEKRRFEEAGAIGALIEQMVAEEGTR